MFAGGAVDGQGVSGFWGCVALDLLKGVDEVLVELFGVAIVDITEFRYAHRWVGRHGVGDFGAEWEVE